MKKVWGLCVILAMIMAGINIFNTDLYAQGGTGGTILYPQMPDVGALIAQSDIIVIGQVTMVTSQLGTNSYGDEIITSDVQFDIEEALKGAEDVGQSIDFTGLEGGTVNDMTMASSAAPLFRQSERSVLFLENSTDGLYVIGGEYGKFDIDSSDNIPEIGETLAYFRIQILSYISGSRLYLPLVLKSFNPSNDSGNRYGHNQTETLDVQIPQYVVPGPRWPGEWPVIGFSINNPGFNDSGTGTITQQNNAIINGATSWRDQSRAHFRYEYDGTTTVPKRVDGINVVIVRNGPNPASPGDIATAYPTWNSFNDELIDCDIVFWDQWSFSLNGQSGFDIQTVALHEFGHCLYLEHSPLTSAVMFATYTGVQQQLTLDDIAGIRHIYGVGSANIWVNDFGYNEEAGGWRVENHVRTLANVTEGDDLPDVIGFGVDGVWVATSTDGSGFSESSLWLNDFGYSSGWRVENHPRMMADVSGDGLDDVVGFGDDGVWVAVANGSGFGTPSLWLNDFGYTPAAGSWEVGKHPRMIAYVNDDSYADIVGFGDDGVWVATSTGSGFSTPSLWLSHFGYTPAAGGWEVGKHPRMMAYVNDDPYADIVGFGAAGVWVATSRGSSDSFNEPSLWSDFFGSWDEAGGWQVEHHPRMMADVNNDDRADVVGFGAGGAWVATAKSSGDGFNTPRLWSSDFGSRPSAGGWQVEHHPRMMADVNDDGRADIVGFGGEGVWVATASTTDNRFEQPALWLSDLGRNVEAGGWQVEKHPRMMADVNGDGRADAVGFGGPGAMVGLSTLQNMFE